MTHKELVEKIKVGNGKWVEKGFEFTINLTSDNNDGTIHVERDGFKAFLLTYHSNDMGEFHISTAKDLKDVNELVRFLMDLNQVVGAGVVFANQVDREVVKEIDPHHDEFLKAQGQIEVYEKIVLGRPVSLS